MTKASKPEKPITPGPVVLFGSGETSPAGRKIFDAIFRKLPDASRVALLETPAGFELNSDRVIGRVGDFISHRLQNYHPDITIIPARKRGTPFSPDEPEIVAPLLDAEMIFMGPGSPTYAVRQLQDSLAWQMIQARHRLGAALALASAAVISISAYALPVYEIYKVGEDLHWKAGLDFFKAYGLPLVFIPHWNNNDGGDELDTSRCFMGRERFARLMEMLPPGLTVIGIDEQTALFMDPHASVCRVIGLGGVTLLHTGHEHQELFLGPAGEGLDEVARIRASHVHQYQSGETFPLSDCCPIEAPPAGEGLQEDVWEQALQAHAGLLARREGDMQTEAGAAEEDIPAEVAALAHDRQEARTRKDWAASDALRQQLAELGWAVLDTPGGQKLQRSEV